MNDICFYCGKPIDASQQHAIEGKRSPDTWMYKCLIPKAVSCWTGGTKQKFRIQANRLVVHSMCVNHNSCIVYTPEEFDNTYASEEQKLQYRKLYKDNEGAIRKYILLILYCLKRQNHCCKICGQHIGVKSCIIRRRDKSKL